MSSILSVKNVSKRYSDFHLNNISFDMPEGCIMGLIGENGAGKTTTIKLILNQIQRHGGGIQVFGLDAVKDEQKIKEQIGVVMDESFFHTTLTTRDVSRIVRRLYESFDDSLFKRYTERFELPGNKKIKEFSRGMKKKLSIAVAMSHAPKLLILDEATSGLDPIVRNQILDVFLEFIQDETRGVLLSSHITSDLERVADYITYIHKGEIIFSERRDYLNEKFAIVSASEEKVNCIPKENIVGIRKSKFGCQALISDIERVKRECAGLTVEDASLEDIMMFHVNA